MAISSWEKGGRIISNVAEYIADKREVSVEFSLIYVDSMSRKVFFEIFNVLKTVVSGSDKKINVLWKYDPDDATILELGKVLHEVVNQPVTFLEDPD